MSGFGNTWVPDFVLEGAKFRFNEPNGLNIGRRAKTDFDVDVAGLLYSCRFVSNPGSKQLLVSLRSTMNNGNVAPVFHRLDYDVMLDTNVLAICDPTLYLNRSLDVSCFLGTVDKNPIGYLTAIVKRVASTIGVKVDDITFWGASAAAIGAAMAVIHLGAGQAVLVNALLDIRNFRRSRHASPIFETLGAATYDDLFKGYSRRLSVSRALESARALGSSPRLLLVQNRHDRRFYRTEYSRFCERWDIDPAGGSDATGDVRTMLYEDLLAGHGHESDDLALKIKQHEFFQQDKGGVNVGALLLDQTLANVDQGR